MSESEVTKERMELIESFKRSLMSCVKANYIRVAKSISNFCRKYEQIHGYMCGENDLDSFSIFAAGVKICDTNNYLSFEDSRYEQEYIKDLRDLIEAYDGIPCTYDARTHRVDSNKDFGEKVGDGIKDTWDDLTSYPSPRGKSPSRYYQKRAPETQKVKHTIAAPFKPSTYTHKIDSNVPESYYQRRKSQMRKFETEISKPFSPPKGSREYYEHRRGQGRTFGEQLKNATSVDARTAAQAKSLQHYEDERKREMKNFSNIFK